MSTSIVEHIPLAVSVTIAPDELIVTRADGRRVSVPLAWFPKLARATAGELQNYELLGDGEGIHWPDLEEDVSVEGLLR